MPANTGSTIYVDTVSMIDGMIEEIRGYRATEHTEAWLVYLFSCETIRIPTHRVAMVVTTEERT
jgi:uncharacterized protein (UPF0248 family)